MKIDGYMFVYIYIFCPFSELKLHQNVLLFFLPGRRVGILISPVCLSWESEKKSKCFL